MTISIRSFLTVFTTSVLLIPIVPAFVAGLAMSSTPVSARDMPIGAENFYKSDKVTVQKVTFMNQYQMNIVGNLFIPNGLKRDAKLPAIIVGHPMGAVKEQSANLYATKMAERGFVTLSFDLPFWGESDGQPRNTVAPDVYSESFSAAVDFLGTQPLVDKGRVGAIGICGSGGFVISAAKIDPRLKAIATVSMYDMGAANRHSLGNSLTLEQRKNHRRCRSPARCRGHRQRDQVHGRVSSCVDGKISPHRTRVLRLLPHAPRVIHAEGEFPRTDHASNVVQQCQVHELLSIPRHRDDFASPAAVHCWREGSLHRIQPGSLQTRRRAEGVAARSERGTR
jgi:hypothetical protein